MKRNWWKRLRFLWAMSKVVPTQWSIVGNRSIEKGVVDGIEVTITIRNTLQPDAYSREELYQMFELIRKHEKIQGWRVPDPDMFTISPQEASTGSLQS